MSEEAVKEEGVHPTRELLKLNISRKRRDFGAPYKFSDSEAHDALMECRQFKNPNFDLIRMEKDVGVQAISDLIGRSVQTPWFGSANAVSQTQTTDWEEEESAQYNEIDLTSFLEDIRSRLELALEQNETIDNFNNDFKGLGDEDLLFGNKSENNLKEFQSFTDFKYSKDKCIRALDWKPDVKGVVAVACSEPNLTETSEKISSSKVTSSVILVWDFVDPIHPQLILEAPSDVLCFRYHPTRTNIIVAGCANGQVVLWDLSRSSHKKVYIIQKAKSSNSSDEEDVKRTVTIIPFTASASIENSHKKPVTDLVWLTDSKISKDGKIIVASGEMTQFMTVSSDSNLLVWEVSEFFKKKAVQKPPQQEEEVEVVWSPLFRLEVQNPENEMVPFGPLFHYFYVPQVVNDQPADTPKIVLATMDGEVFSADWEKLVQNPAPALEKKVSRHFAPAVALQQSPFFADIFLSAADWTINIWKFSLKDPLLLSPCASSYVTAVRWSPTRPGVFFAGKADGSVDIWDLLDKSYQPSMTQVVCSSPISSLEFLPPHMAATYGNNHLLAVGDSQGRLHILEVPRNLTRKVHKENFFIREEKKVSYVQRRQTVRNEERLQRETELAAKMVDEELAARSRSSSSSVMSLRKLEPEPATKKEVSPRPSTTPAGKDPITKKSQKSSVQRVGTTAAIARRTAMTSKPTTPADKKKLLVSSMKKSTRPSSPILPDDNAAHPPLSIEQTVT